MIENTFIFDLALNTYCCFLFPLLVIDGIKSENSFLFKQKEKRDVFKYLRGLVLLQF